MIFRTMASLVMLSVVSTFSCPAVATEPVDAIIVLAVDVSSSVDDAGWAIQREGYARAFESPEVIDAIRGGRRGRIAVTFVQWADFTNRRQDGGWVLLSAASCAEYATAIRGFSHLFGGMTSIEGALKFSMDLIESAPFTSDRRIIDISGDGKNNQSFENGGGESTLMSRLFALEKGIVINGLAILGSENDIGRYYEESVKGGPGSFSILVEEPREIAKFTDAVVRKLRAEIIASR